MDGCFLSVANVVQNCCAETSKMQNVAPPPCTESGAQEEPGAPEVPGAREKSHALEEPGAPEVPGARETSPMVWENGAEIWDFVAEYE